MRRCRALSLSAGLVGLAAGAGGGGGGSGAADTGSGAPPAAGPSPASSPAVTGTRATCNLADFQAEAMRLVNAHRSADYLKSALDCLERKIDSRLFKPGYEAEGSGR
jgi:hypothetical protein